MDPCPWRAKPPIGFAGTPERAPGQREIELLRLMRMGWILGVRAEHEDAAGDPVAYEGAALADPFAEAVVVEEALAEVGDCIGLPPGELAGERRDRVNQRPRARRGVSRQAWKRGNDGKRARDDRPRNQLRRPVAKERLSLRACRFEEGVENVDLAA
jgi:hypothetical protein